MDVEDVKVMLKFGLSYSQVAEHYGVTRNSVATFVRRRIRGVHHSHVGSWQSFHPKHRVPSMPYVPGVTNDGVRV